MFFLPIFFHFSWKFIVFTRDLEKQRSNHEKLLENVIEQYNENLAIVDEINKKCNEDMANTTYIYSIYTLYTIEKKKRIILHANMIFLQC